MRISEMQIIEDHVDSRSNEIAIRLMLKNNLDRSIHLVKLVPMVPEEVDIVPVNDITSQATILRYDELCHEFTNLSNKIKMGVSCCFFSDRMIGALKILVGG